MSSTEMIQPSELTTLLANIESQYSKILANQFGCRLILQDARELPDILALVHDQLISKRSIQLNLYKVRMHLRALLQLFVDHSSRSRLKEIQADAAYSQRFIALSRCISASMDLLKTACLEVVSEQRVRMDPYFCAPGGWIDLHGHYALSNTRPSPSVPQVQKASDLRKHQQLRLQNIRADGTHPHEAPAPDQAPVRFQNPNHLAPDYDPNRPPKPAPRRRKDPPPQSGPNTPGSPRLQHSGSASSSPNSPSPTPPSHSTPLSSPSSPASPSPASSPADAAQYYAVSPPPVSYSPSSPHYPPGAPVGYAGPAVGYPAPAGAYAAYPQPYPAHPPQYAAYPVAAHHYPPPGYAVYSAPPPYLASAPYPAAAAPYHAAAPYPSAAPYNAPFSVYSQSTSDAPSYAKYPGAAKPNPYHPSKTVVP